MVTTIVYIVLYCFPNSILAQTKYFGPYLGQEPPGREPKIFVPDELRSNSNWWWHGALVFTSDGREFYMDLYEANQGFRIDYMEMVANNEWSSPQQPTFCGEYETTSPSFVDDGNKVFFLAERPDGLFFNSLRNLDGWSVPQVVNIPIPGNLNTGWRLSVTKDKTIYTQMAESTSTYFDIYCIRHTNGTYLQPEKLDNNINSAYWDMSAFIDPDEEYIVFESNRPGGYGRADLYISFKQVDDTWTPAINMGESINSSAGEGSPFVTSDGLYLFFNSDRVQQYVRNPYWIDAQIIDDLKAAAGINDNDREGQLPKKFQLYQNYPNPFNPNTTIEFDLPKTSNVTLKIFNILGEEVATLVSDKLTAGSYTYEWDASNMASGVYLYKLEAEGFVQTKKMILMK